MNPTCFSRFFASVGWGAFLILALRLNLLTQPATATDVPFSAQSVISSSADDAKSVYAVDLDGDGDMDVLGAAYNDDEIVWWENTAGDGSAWTVHTLTTTADGARSIYATDMDHDGDLDVLYADATNDTIAWFENKTIHRSVLFAGAVNYAAGDGPWFIAQGDLDGDGDLDLATANLNTDNVSVLKNNGSGDQRAGAASAAPRVRITPKLFGAFTRRVQAPLRLLIHIGR